MFLKLWQMTVPVCTCITHLVRLLKHAALVTEIYECHFSAWLCDVTTDGSHGQYMLVWKMDRFCSTHCLLALHMHIVWKSRHRSPYIPQLPVNMFFAECRLSRKSIRICPLHANVLTWVVWGVKEGIIIKWYRHTLKRETDSESGHVICSALLHVKWNTSSLSYYFSISSSLLSCIFTYVYEEMALLPLNYHYFSVNIICVLFLSSVTQLRNCNITTQAGFILCFTLASISGSRQ